MDLKVGLYLLGVAALLAGLMAKVFAAAIIGGALMLAATGFGWSQRQRSMREKVRLAHRRKPEFHRPRRRYYFF